MIQLYNSDSQLKFTLRYVVWYFIRVRQSQREVQSCKAQWSTINTNTEVRKKLLTLEMRTVLMVWDIVCYGKS